MSNDKIDIVVPINKQELWEATLGGGWEYMPWWVKLEYPSGTDWDTIGEGKFVLTACDPDDPDQPNTTKTITIEDLAKAYSVALSENYSHCGGSWDLEDPDACVSDGLLQLAFFGEITYG
jgi:hypothetical protein